MHRIKIWNNTNGWTNPTHFCDALIEKDKVHLEIKYGRNNYQVMPLEEIQKQILNKIKEIKSK